MKALLFSELGKVKLVDVEKPIIKHPKDVIIKVTLTAICGSDIHLKNGHIPTTAGYILGHEYVGIIDQVGSDVCNFKVGDRVVGAGTPFCGECENCKSGNIQRCLNGGIFGSGKEYGDLNGSHAEYMRVPYGDTTLQQIPDELTDEQVLFVGDILSTGWHSVIKANVNSNSNVVIYGAGAVGLCAVATAKLFNPQNIIVVGNENMYRLDLAKKMGATETILSSKIDSISKIMGITNGKGADSVIEAVGNETSIQNAIKCASIGSCVSIVGVAGNSINIPIFEMMMKNLRLEVGLVKLDYMKSLIDLIKKGDLDVTSLITHRMSLNNIEEAFDIFEHKKDNVIKIAIKP